jgi:hypothetical protein
VSKVAGCAEIRENSVFIDVTCNAQRLSSGLPNDTAQLREEEQTLFGSGCWGEGVCVENCAKHKGELQAVGPL